MSRSRRGLTGRPPAAALLLTAGLWVCATAPAALALPSAAAEPALSGGRIEEARALVRRGRSAYEGLKGYTARMHRELKLKNGRLKIDEMFLRYDKPRTIFLKYTSGAQNGLQVLWSEGRFDGKLMTRPPGPMFDFIPIVAMSPDDKRIKNEESRPIQNAGIGHLIEKFAADWAAADAAGQAEVVSIISDEVRVYGANAGEPVRTRRLEVLLKTPGRAHPKTVVHFRESDGLPVQMELFKAGSSSPDEAYTYHAIQADPAKDDPTFLGMIDKRLLKYYRQI